MQFPLFVSGFAETDVKVRRHKTMEPAHEIMALFVLRKLTLVGLDVWCFVGPFVYFHTSCVRTAKALARLRGCAGSPEPSLVAYAVSTIISSLPSETELRQSRTQFYLYASPSLIIRQEIKRKHHAVVYYYMSFHVIIGSKINKQEKVSGFHNGTNSSDFVWSNKRQTAENCWAILFRISDE